MLNIFSDIVEHSEDGIVVIDKYHNIVYFNKGAQKIFGYVPDEVLEQHLNVLLPERFHLHNELMIEEVGTGSVACKRAGQHSHLIFGLRKDGTEFVTGTAIVKIKGKFSQHYAVVVRNLSEKKKTEEEILRIAATDPLTGAFNRREFTALADHEGVRSSRYNHPLSILMLDLDHFKRLNDVYGHAVGDKVLQKFTTLCCDTLRTMDIFGRWGGEEFVVLLPETDAKEAAVIAERLRKIVSQSVLVHDDQKISFTVSIGITQYQSGETTIDAPFGRVDAAVYDAKKAGRDRISIYRDE